MFPAPYTLLPDTVHFKEFYGGFNGTCGETAVTAALICALRLGLNHDQAVSMMLSVTHEMQAKGWASANGASTLWSLAREAIVRHATIALEYDYQEPLKQDWHAVLLANAGVKPIVLQVGLAYNLWGQDNTGNDEAGVHYHFICVVGKCADGYICMDGDNWKIEQELSIYSYATLQAADICGLLMLEEAPVPVPTNWKDDPKAGVLTAPNGKTVVRGFRDFILAEDWQGGSPVDEESARASLELSNPALGAGSIQHFDKVVLEWTSGRGVFEQYCGREIVALEAEAASLKSQLDAANAIIASLKGAHTDPAIVAALDACAQYFGAQAQLAAEVAAAKAKVN